MNKNRIVIDVNVFLAAFFFKSKIGESILDSITGEIYILLTSEEFWMELRAKLDHFKNKVSNQEFVQI